MSSPLVKICGIRRPEDAIAAVDLGADFIGMIFADSPRRLSPEQASLVVEQIRVRSEYVRTVGVFVDETPAVINQIADAVGLDLIQFHGDQSEDAISQVERPSIRVVRVRSEADVVSAPTGSDWLLFDTWVPGVRGGTGRTFDWTLLSSRPADPFFLSGGLNPDNIMQAVEAASPDAVDVSSGVEDQPGIKNHQKIERLIRQVKG